MVKKECREKMKRKIWKERDVNRDKKSEKKGVEEMKRHGGFICLFLLLLFNFFKPSYLFF